MADSLDIARLTHQLREGVVDKKQLLEYLAAVQAQKRTSKDPQLEHQEASLKRELIKKLIEEKRRALGDKRSTESVTRSPTNNDGGTDDVDYSINYSQISPPPSPQPPPVAHTPPNASTPPLPPHYTIPRPNSRTSNQEIMYDGTHSLNSSIYSTNNTKESFFERTVRWKEQKTAEYDRTREEMLANELSECTFHPTINTSKAPKVAPPVVARLFLDSKAKLREWEHEKKRKEDEEIERTCTFKPQTNARHPTPSKNRPPSPSGHNNAQKDIGPKFTFSPTVNKVPTQMVTAVQYLSMDPFERLSRTTTTTAHSHNNSPPSTTSTRPGRNTARPLTPPQPAPPPLPAKSRPTSAPPGNRSENTTVATHNEEKASFKDFLVRQQDHIIKKQHKIELVSRQSGQAPHPALCERSRQIIQQKQPGDFLERLARDSLRDKRLRKEPRDEGCTFQPRILPTSKNRKPRSVVELSIGDKLKHDAHVEEMRQKVEDDELKQATFKPRTTNYPVESRLKILTDPDAYMDRVHKEQEMREEQYAERLLQKEKQMLEGCTFHPEVHDAPTYVKRIARSMALARGNKSRTSISPPKKPEWL